MVFQQILRITRRDVKNMGPFSKIIFICILDRVYSDAGFDLAAVFVLTGLGSDLNRAVKVFVQLDCLNCTCTLSIC